MFYGCVFKFFLKGICFVFDWWEWPDGDRRENVLAPHHMFLGPLVWCRLVSKLHARIAAQKGINKEAEKKIQ